MKIISLNGEYLTQTERRSIAQMIEKRQTNARNRPNTKTYEVIQGTPTRQGIQLKIRIGTYEKTFVWDYVPKWNSRTVSILATEKTETEL